MVQKQMNKTMIILLGDYIEKKHDAKTVTQYINLTWRSSFSVITKYMITVLAIVLFISHPRISNQILINSTTQRSHISKFQNLLLTNNIKYYKISI